jgi:hypothetical protein
MDWNMPSFCLSHDVGFAGAFPLPFPFPFAFWPLASGGGCSVVVGREAREGRWYIDRPERFVSAM